MTAIDALSREDVAARLAGSSAERAAFLRDAAEQGHPEAQAVFGQMLLDGSGVAADQRAALRWFVKAAAQHHLMALNMVGRCYDLGWGVAVNKARAADCYRVAASRNLVEGIYNYATLLTLGHGVAEDKAKALALFEEAGARGYAKAINYVGSFAEDGWACEPDHRRAAACYAQAAEGGDFRGAFNHARMLVVDGNIKEACHWFGRAVEDSPVDFRAKVFAWLAGHSRADVRAIGGLLLEVHAC